MKETYVKRLY